VDPKPIQKHVDIRHRKLPCTIGMGLFALRTSEEGRLFLELKDVSDVSDVSESGLRTRHGCGVSRSWGPKRCS